MIFCFVVEENCSDCSRRGKLAFFFSNRFVSLIVVCFVCFLLFRGGEKKCSRVARVANLKRILAFRYSGGVFHVTLETKSLSISDIDIIRT